MLYYVSRLILTIFGWNANVLPLGKREVLIYPHTSNWDFVLMVLYRFANPTLTKNTYFLVKPQLFDHNKFLAYFLEKMNMIPAAKLETVGSNSTKRIIDFLNEKEEFVLVMSPEGSRDRKEWRSGYYWIAKATKAAIRVAGLDYKDKKYKSTMLYYPWETPESDKNFRQKLMRCISPLYPEYCITHDPGEPNNQPIDWMIFLSCVLGVVGILFYVFQL